MDLSVSLIVSICNGKLFCGEEDIVCKTFTQDTRTIKQGDTYIALRGTNFDGNKFYKEAFKKGANCCILEEDFFKIDEKYQYSKPIILVKDASVALRLLASYKREHAKAWFVGITGSVGKTSTRDMVYSVLSTKYKTLKNEKNYNNGTGVPLTLLRLQDEDVAVIEMGMNALKEIENLSNLVKPDIAVITNVGTAHIGELGSREAILQAKTEITSGLNENGTLLINNDNDMLHAYYKEHKENIVTVGIENESDFTAVHIIEKESSSHFSIKYKEKLYDVDCPIPGRAYIYNALLAFAVGILLNVDEKEIIKGLQEMELTQSRVEIKKTVKNITIINDTYNASPDAMKSSIEILSNTKSKRKVAVLGSMLELGEYSKMLHEEVGKCVAEHADILLTVGENAKHIARRAKEEGMREENIFVLNSNKKAIDKLKAILKEEDAVLVKASHSLCFIEIVKALEKFYNE